MTTNFLDAYTTVTTLFRTYWAANAGAIVGNAYVPELRFGQVQVDNIPQKNFGRMTMEVVTDGQSSFRQTDGKRFRADGLIYIQIFGAKTDTQGAERARQLAYMSQRRLRKALDCISTRNVRINAAPDEQKFWRLNVIAEFSYDEIQG